MLGFARPVMNVKRTAALLVVGGALAVWLAAAANSAIYDSPQVRAVKPPPIDSRGAVLAGEIARLHEQLRPSAAPRQPSRNLFSFAVRQRKPAPPTQTPRPALSDAPAPRPAAPPLKLSGIAEDQTTNGLVRTAIMSTSGQLFLAKEGEQVTERFRVIKISSDVVELTDLSDNTTLRLALK